MKQVSRYEAAEEEVLNRIAAIQAAAEILHDNDNMPRQERHMFLAAITQETARLSRLVKVCR
jgi:hypothetical protein